MNQSPLKTRIALVTGANRGIGYEVCRQLAHAGAEVVLTARDATRGAEAVKALALTGVRASHITLDVEDPGSISAATRQTASLFDRIDILVNNAGGFYDQDQTAANADLAFVRRVLELNLLGPWAATQAFLPLLRKSDHGRIVMVSSSAGSHGDPNFGLGKNAGVPAYGASKAPLNARTVKLATELKDAKILVNAVCPGFTATQPGMAEMGARPIADGAASVVWARLLSDGGPTGGFYRDGNEIPW